MNILQIICIGIIAGIAGQIASPVGTTWGNYVLSRPLIAAFIIGMIVQDIPGLFMMCIPVQLTYLILVTPGGVVHTDIRAASYAGLAAAYGAVQLSGFGFPGAAAVIAALVFGRIGTYVFALETRINERFAEDAVRDLDRGRTDTMFVHAVLKPLCSHVFVSGTVFALLIAAGMHILAFLLTGIMQVQVLYRAVQAAGILIPLAACAGMAQAEAENIQGVLVLGAGLVLGFFGMPLWITVVLMIAALLVRHEETAPPEEEEI